MKQDNQRANMHQIMHVCTKLAMEACRLVKDCYQNNEVKKYDKGIDDPVTQADFKIQTMLIRGIRNISPKIKIVGQETKQYEGDIDTNYDKLPDIQLPGQVKFDHQYLLDELCIWIDPIDNTKGFIEGKAQAVTVLIGISYKGKSQAGIIGTPFKLENSVAVYKPSVIIGSISEKFAYQIYDQTKTWQLLQKPTNFQLDKPRILVSPTRKNRLEKVIAQQLKGQLKIAGGAGYKAVLIIKGEAQLFAYCDSFTKKWDSCAGQAIIKALGGYFIQTNQKNIFYDPNAQKFQNKNGLICGFVDKCKNITLQIVKKSKQSKL